MILEDSDEEVSLPEKPKVKVIADDRPPPSTGEETSGSEWDSEDKIPLAQLRERWRKQESNSEPKELPIKSRLRGATRAEPQEKN